MVVAPIIALPGKSARHSCSRAVVVSYLCFLMQVEKFARANCEKICLCLGQSRSGGSSKKIVRSNSLTDLHGEVEMKLSKTSQNVLDDFAVAAKHWGWQEDQGYGKAVTEAHEQFVELREAVEKRMAKLEKDAADLRKKLRGHE